MCKTSPQGNSSKKSETQCCDSYAYFRNKEINAFATKGPATISNVKFQVALSCTKSKGGLTLMSENVISNSNIKPKSSLSSKDF